MENMIASTTATTATTTARYYVCEWEANGYDDSDGDIILYNAETNSIEHNFWSTRYYAPCNNTLLRTTPYTKGVEMGAISSDVLKKALFDDTFGREDSINMNKVILFSEYCGKEMNLPVVVNKGRGYRGKGILLRTWEENKTNPFRSFNQNYSVTYGIIYNKETNSIHKTRLHNIEFDYEAMSVADVKAILFNAMSITDICHYISSANSCSSFKSNWISEAILNAICPVLSVDISTAADKTVPEKKREEARTFIENKKKEIREWASSLGDKTEEEIERIVERTLIKYYSKKLDLC